MKTLPTNSTPTIDWLGQLGRNWPTTTLGRVGRFYMGTTFPDTFQGNSNGDIPFMKVSDFPLADRKGVLSTANNWISTHTARHLGARILPEGCVLYPRVGAALLLNQRRITGSPCIVDDNVRGFQPYSGDPRYWRYLMTLLDMGRITNPGPVPSVSETQVAAVRVPSPPRDEQRRIADFLDAETARIDQLGLKYRKLALLAAERATAATDEAFAGLPDSSTIPVSAACSNIVDCVNKTAPTSDLVTPYRMIRTTNIRNGEVDAENTFSVEHSTFIEWNRRGTPQAGDILFTREAPLGQVGILRARTPVFLGQRVMLYRANDKVIKNELLLYNFLATHMREQLRRLGAGSLHEHMRVGDGLKLRVHCPPRAKQDELVRKIGVARGKSLHLERLANRQLNLLTERRQALITATVTGQFDVSTASGRNVTDGVPTS
ncbi:restriction endonuclease subunit S [Streptomyces sp. NPDC001822]|uniref:restriction endonuclease subunit S n=1 Tax=Streptomyces sp. NPDC001822 TaxID=3364614 RepID=UPI0036737735